MAMAGAIRQMRTGIRLQALAGLCAQQLAPVSKSSGAVQLEIEACVEVAFLVEMVVD